jgi:hypothetical protein
MPRKHGTKCEQLSSLTETVNFAHNGEITMKRFAGILVTLMFVIVASHLHADVSIENRGSWPVTWPQELDPLREKSRTIEGPLARFLHYEIPFSERDTFESAWSHLLKVKSPESPIILIRSPYKGAGATKGSSMKAGVLINSYPFASSTDDAAISDAPAKATTPKSTNTTFVVLVVDGEVVDLNRIPLPKNTYIQDERFKDSGITKP